MISVDKYTGGVALGITVILAYAWMFTQASEVMRETMWLGWESLILVLLGGGAGGVVGNVVSTRTLQRELKELTRLAGEIRDNQ